MEAILRSVRPGIDLEPDRGVCYALQHALCCAAAILDLHSVVSDLLSAVCRCVGRCCSATLKTGEEISLSPTWVAPRARADRSRCRAFPVGLGWRQIRSAPCTEPLLPWRLA